MSRLPFDARMMIATLILVTSASTPVQSQAIDRPDDEAHQTTLGPPVNYLMDIKPILVRRCYACHGPDPSTRSGSLRLDERTSATRLRDGYQVIKPGQSDESELLARIASTDPADQMPPEGPRLTEEEIDIVRRWIDQGSPYQEHWSFKPVNNPPLPRGFEPHSQPVRDPVDQFVFAKLDAAGIQGSGDAPPAQQLRRLSIDLTGLPPDEKDVLAFEADPSDVRWSELVEQYLDDPAFGERWGRHWLDLVRYAETCGHEFDYPIHDAWKYRDYVIRALNDGVPYDQFVREHIAGDLIAPRIDPESGVNQAVLATGFWHLHQAVHGPVDVRQDEIERIDNQIDVMTKTFMSLTVSCARCHDHKFDPITQADYYGLSGILRSSRRSRTYLDPGNEIAASRAEVVRMLAQMEPIVSDTAHLADRARSLPEILNPLRDALVDRNTPGAIQSETLFEGFEGDDFGRWEPSGNAFSRGPQKIATVREPFRAHFGSGSGMVNTCDDRPGGNGDRDTGSLLSPEFTIAHPEIVFRMSGGRDSRHTCVQLVVDEEVVHSAHGRDDVILREIRWDVDAYQGQSGRIQIIDTDSGAWGHVVVDDIRFRVIPGSSKAMNRTIGQLAEETGLSTDDVTRWLSALHDDTITDHAHPLQRWAIKPISRLNGPPPDEIHSNEIGAANWRNEGHAWPRKSGARLDSGQFGGRFQGTLRSNAFTLNHDWVLIRARGEGTIRITVNGFMMNQFNPLLFEGLIQTIDGPWRVVKMHVGAYAGEYAWIELIDDSDGALEVDWIAFDDSEEASIAQADPPDPSWGDRKVRKWLIRNGLVNHLPESVAGHAKALEAQQAELNERNSEVAAPMRALALRDGNVLEDSILIRGNHTTPGTPTRRALVEAVCGTLEIRSEGSGRLELAEQILGVENPLTARVAVNRIWQQLFGRGIVQTSDDFGALGSMPTHPNLLDHMATDFARDWSIKRMIGRIVRSSTYRRSSTATDETVFEKDPTNDLLARARIRRLDAEAIRDSALFIAGKLDDRRHGPSVPVHLTSFMTGRGRPAASGPVDGAGRRSIYLEVRRNFPSPLLAVFDRPVPTTTNGRRNESNVPAQALAMMNDEFIHQMAAAWGMRAEQHGDLDRIWRRAFARPPTPDELELCTAFLEERAEDEDSWTQLCHALMNTKEFIYLH